MARLKTIIRQTIILIKLLAKLKATILPNLDKLTSQISELGNSVDELWHVVSYLSAESQDLKNNVAEIKGNQSGLEKSIILQNQLIQVLLMLFKAKRGGDSIEEDKGL